MLLITTDFPPHGGGIADYLHNICHLLGSSVTVLTPNMPGDSEFDTCQSYQVIRLPIDYSSLWKRSLLLTPGWIRRASFLISHQRIGVVVGGFVSFQILLTLTYLRARYHITTKLIVHGGDLLTIDVAPARRVIESRLLGNIDGFAVNSKFTRDILVEKFCVPPERIRILNPGTNFARFQTKGHVSIDGWPAERQKILTVGRLVDYKGFDMVTRSVAQLVKAGLDVGYIVVGKGNDGPRLEELAASLGIHDRVHFAGFVPDEDLPRYYNACDVFALVSRQVTHGLEGFGIVFLEANACGKPVIGGRSGGMADAIADRESGLLVDPASQDAISQTLHNLLTDQALARRLGEYGRRRVSQKFDWAQRQAEVQRVFLE